MIDEEIPDPPPPLLEPEDMPDVRSLTPEELAMVPFDLGKWRCAADGCTCYARVRDYGIFPMVMFRRNDWVDVTRNLVLCARHWKLYRPAKKAGLDFPFKLKDQATMDRETHNIFTLKTDINNATKTPRRQRRHE